MGVLEQDGGVGRKLRILALEPYAAVSHMVFLEGLERCSRHEIVVSSMPARKWKWRMRTAALHFAAEVERGGPWDLLFVSDFLNLAELVPLLSPAARDLPSVVYFHENQLTYPLQENESRDFHFALTHFYSMLTAKHSLFNSEYHRSSLMRELPQILKLVPDVAWRPWMASAEERTSVLPLGHELEASPPRTDPNPEPLILWNHRWEYDKNPREFVDALIELDRRGLPFRVRVLGERFRVAPPEFEELQTKLAHRLEHVGFVPGREAYLKAVRGADIVVSTAHHEFFGLGTLEALRLGLHPVLPNDLAYPELLPRDPEVRERFLYPREGGVIEPLARAIRTVREGSAGEARNALVDWTDQYRWPELAPRYDEVFEAVVAGKAIRK